MQKEQRRLIGQRIEALRNGLQGAIRKLLTTKNRNRFRAGDYRVFFVLENDLVAVYAVRNRKEAYE